MALVRDVLRAPGLEGLRLLAGPSDGTRVLSVRVLERVTRIGQAPAGSITVLTEAASEFEGYQLDMALRAAGAGGVAALAFYDSEARGLSRSASLVAERASVAVLAVPAALDPGSVCVAAQRSIDGEAELWLARLDGLREALAGLGPDASLDDLAKTGSRVTETSIRIAPAAEDVQAEDLDTIAVAGRATHTVEADGARGWIAAALCASAASRTLEGRRLIEEAPIRSRAAIIAELLLTRQLETVAERARDFGIAVDGWHIAAQIEIDDRGSRPGANAVAEHALREELLRVALRVARAQGSATWEGTQLSSALFLVSTQRSDPGLRGTTERLSILKEVVNRLKAYQPERTFAVGVGGAHEGADGIRASGAEAAAAALLARADERGNRVLLFDATGLRRMLLAWSGSTAARQAIDDLLAPLDSLGREKSDTAVRTLAAYLSEQGSLLRAGERLRVHRNAISYRIRKYVGLLEADLADPDDRFALELACRIRLMQGPFRQAADGD